MTTGKNAILKAIRDAQPPAAELPVVEGAWTTYADRRQQFIETLVSVGGTAICVRSLAELSESLRALPVYAEARQIVSYVDGAGEANVDIAAIADPHDLADVDVAILPGEFAVAENGAIWITDRNVPQRVVYYLCQHLVLVLRASEIVDHMHAAYERLRTAGQGGRSAFAGPVFGAFISGPSKTADIEQALVIGAHGPRSLTVFLLGE
jgi:L-lactate dehydrogenase complex protein LldG